MKMIAGAFYIPKKNKLNTLGDDAHFICEEKQTIGVADGVGGWAKKGVDAGEYARELMTNAVIAIGNEPGDHGVDPKRVLTEAYYNTDAIGSSTACIITLNGHCLHIANVGDSGFLLLREGAEIYRSPVQQHYFNCPYQLGKSNISDHPNLAQVFKVAVRPGDVIVVGTDGLFDNMFDHQIEDVVKMGIDEGIEPQKIAWALAEHAFHYSMEEEAPTPFAEAAKEAGMKHCGGKVDDITVIVGYIESCYNSYL
ncbi:hypothetical protein F0562_020901 [Nyssa sinensis]|uniref:Protein phosphatase n=1 Tax=Nyssa sinensis TaxID=561372 RepID=A0A5J5BRX0_9ASTE|nr:hypothetical protein F0562_020901 [Nyssa sinensis]